MPIFKQFNQKIDFSLKKKMISWINFSHLIKSIWKSDFFHDIIGNI